VFKPQKLTNEYILEFLFYLPSPASITNSAGEQISLQGNTFTNTITGAYALPRMSGWGNIFGPIFYLPPEDHYSVLIDGQSTSDETLGALAINGPDFIFRIENLMVGPETRNTVEISPSGEMISISFNEDQNINMYVASLLLPEERQFDLNNLTILEGAELILSGIHSDQMSITFKSEKTSSYELTIIQTNEDGQKHFSNGKVELHPNAAHIFDLSKWDDQSLSQLLVDLTDENRFDDRVTIKNLYDSSLSVSDDTVATNSLPQTLVILGGILLIIGIIGSRIVRKRLI
jgi:hypothetical protein